MLLLQQFEICIQIELFVSEGKGRDGEATIFTEMSLSHFAAYSTYIIKFIIKPSYLVIHSIIHSKHVSGASVMYQVLCSAVEIKQ